MIKKLSSLIAVLSLCSVVMDGQRINLETVVVSNSVALHPLIFDVQKDGQNDIVVVDDYIDLEGNDALNIKTVSWFSDQGKEGGQDRNRGLDRPAGGIAHHGQHLLGDPFGGAGGLYRQSQGN